MFMGGAHDSFDDAFRTARNFAARMRESIQRDRASPEWRGHAPCRIQIRFVGGTQPQRAAGQLQLDSP